MLLIDGASGEGGGQLLRTCLSLSAISGRPFRLTNIRANRARPGLRPQHLTAVLAAAAICDAEINGAELNSATLEFAPRCMPKGGIYRFDVAEVSAGGSAGSVTLVLQALLWPLMFAGRPSQLTLLGGTHVPYSPPYHYLAEVNLPAFSRLGASFSPKMNAWGWYPRGGGSISVEIKPVSQLIGASFHHQPPELVRGLASATNLPAHIPQRMSRRAVNLLAARNLKAEIQPVRDRGIGPGAGIMLWIPNGGFSSLGRKGIPADQVAQSAVDELLSFVQSKSAVDQHLADQLLLPMALAKGRSTLTTPVLTAHTMTNVELLRKWLAITIQVEGEMGHQAHITVDGSDFQSQQHL